MKKTAMIIMAGCLVVVALLVNAVNANAQSSGMEEALRIYQKKETPAEITPPSVPTNLKQREAPLPAASAQEVFSEPVSKEKEEKDNNSLTFFAGLSIAVALVMIILSIVLILVLLRKGLTAADEKISSLGKRLEEMEEREELLDEKIFFLETVEKRLEETEGGYFFVELENAKKYRCYYGRDQFGRIKTLRFKQGEPQKVFRTRELEEAREIAKEALTSFELGEEDFLKSDAFSLVRKLMDEGVIREERITEE